MTSITQDNKFQYQVLDASHKSECALVMAKAFSNSPIYNFIFSNLEETARVQALEWIFTRNTNLILGKCPSALRGLINKENGKVVACFFLTPNPFQKASMLEMILAGLWLVPFWFGLGPYRRLVQFLDDEKADAANTYEEKKDYVMLERMAVLPEYQGRGMGSRALQAALEDVQHEVRLTTQEERNTRFYQRLGFEVLGKKDYYEDTPDVQFRSWSMVLKVTE